MAASLSAYNEEQRRCGRRWIYLWGSMGVGLTPAPALLRDQAEGPVRDAVASLRLVPVMFELGARPHPPRRVYRAYLAQSQVFVGV